MKGGVGTSGLKPSINKISLFSDKKDLTHFANPVAKDEDKNKNPPVFYKSRKYPYKFFKIF